MCLLLGLSCIRQPLWDMCECQAEIGDIANITEATVSFCGSSIK